MDPRLARLALPELQRQAVDRQRAKLAGIGSLDARVNLAVAESFVVGYRWVLALASGMTTASACFGWMLIEGSGKKRHDLPDDSFTSGAILALKCGIHASGSSNSTVLKAPLCHFFSSGGDGLSKDQVAESKTYLRCERRPEVTIILPDKFQNQFTNA